MSGLDQDFADVHEKVGLIDVSDAKRELDDWKAKVLKADDVTSGLKLRKHDGEREKGLIKQQLEELIKKKREEEREKRMKEEERKFQINVLTGLVSDLEKEVKRKREELKQKRQENQRLQRKHQISVNLPVSSVEFTKAKKDCDDVSADEPIRGQFSVSQQGTVLLRGGALITFEEERVVQDVLQMQTCSVSFDDQTLHVKPKRIKTEPLVQFQLCLSVSRSALDVWGINRSLLASEQSLALALSRPSRGGAEVERLEYEEREGRARVHFLKPAELDCMSLARSLESEFQARVKVSPVFDQKLNNFQTFSMVPRRTLLLEGVADCGDEEEVQDQLEIHFQKPSNRGGEIEHTLYVGGGRSLLAVFS